MNNDKLQIDFDNYKDKTNEISYIYKILQTNILVCISYYHTSTLSTSFIS